MIEGPEELLELSRAYEPSRAFLTALELGMFGAVRATPLTAAQVAEALGTHAGATSRLLHTMCALGLMSKRGALFRNTRLAERYLVDSSPDYLMGLHHAVHGWTAWSTLTYATRSGRAIGRDLVDPKARVSSTEAYMAAMATQAQTLSRLVRPHLQLAKARTMLDIGGGPGIFSIAFAKANRKLAVTVLDRAEIQAICERNVRDAGLAGRITFVLGDYLTGELGSGYDLIFLSQIVHGNSLAQDAALVGAAARALNPGGCLAVLDYFMNEPRTAPRAGALFSLSMLVTSEGGDTYSEHEVATWMTNAGLDAPAICAIADGQSLMTARKPGGTARAARSAPRSRRRAPAKRRG